ncbi:MAG: phosphatase PAP2 family protein [Dermatophilaceae bacterium]
MTASVFARQVAPRLLRSAAAAVVTCLPVAVLTVIVTRGWDPLARLDERTIRSATDVTRAHPLLFDALIAWQEAFQPWHVYLVAAMAAGVVWRAALRARAAWGLATMVVGWNLGLQVKLLVERARPVYDDPVSSAPGFSFPSGHAFNTAMATGTVLVMAWPLLVRRPRPTRVALVAAAVVVVALTAADRVFLGVHFPTDVTAGVLLAAGLTSASYAGFRYRPRETP